MSCPFPPQRWTAPGSGTPQDDAQRAALSVLQNFDDSLEEDTYARIQELIEGDVRRLRPRKGSARWRCASSTLLTITGFRHAALPNRILIMNLGAG